MIGGKKSLLSDVDAHLLRNRERGVFDAEVKIVKEPKLFILLAHLSIEHMLERALSCKLSRTKGLMGKGGLSFEKKAVLAEAVQAVPAEVIVSVLLLNKLRNNCAHTFKFQPTERKMRCS